MKLNPSEKTLAIAAAKSGMAENTARKYLKSGKLPSQLSRPRDWRTHPDAFEAVWDEIRSRLETNPGLEAKTLFEHLQRRYPGRFQDGQLRTLQRKIKKWRALEGPPKEVYFPQVYQPGVLAESDFTDMSALGVTIEGLPFDHLIYHFVLPYSNWETGNVCFSESFESLSEGLQNALWKLGGVPHRHRSDRLSAAVQKEDHPEEFTNAYSGLLRHYGVCGEKIQADRPNENGDVEQRHHRFKRALEQALMLRESRDFENRAAYEQFLEKLFIQLNAGRQERFQEELPELRSLPALRLDDCRELEVSVGPSSTIRVFKNVYSVPSRLIKETVKVKAYAEHLDVWYAQTRIERLPRQRGSKKHRINYRHIIDWLVRKPGAFENYRYRDDLFPSSIFRMAYDFLKDQDPLKGHKPYLKILLLAAQEGENLVEKALAHLFRVDRPISEQSVKDLIAGDREIPDTMDVSITPVDLETYDGLLDDGEAA